MEPEMICEVCGAPHGSCGTPLAALGISVQFEEWAPEEAKVEQATIRAPRDVWREEPVPGSKRRRRVLVVRKGDLLTPSEARRYRIRPVEASQPATDTT